MKAIEFKESYTKKLGAGDNPNTNDLAICRAVGSHIPNRAFVVSCWEPSEEELAAIIRDKKIYLAVMANPQYPSQPPVSIAGVNPMDPDSGYNLVAVPEGELIPVTSEYLAQLKEAGNSPVGVVADDKFFETGVLTTAADRVIDGTNMKLSKDDQEPLEERTGGMGTDGKAI
jgi:hypothetical protein